MYTIKKKSTLVRPQLFTKEVYTTPLFSKAFILKTLSPRCVTVVDLTEEKKFAALCGSVSVCDKGVCVPVCVFGIFQACVLVVSQPSERDSDPQGGESVSVSVCVCVKTNSALFSSLWIMSTCFRTAVEQSRGVWRECCYSQTKHFFLIQLTLKRSGRLLLYEEMIRSSRGHWNIECSVHPGESILPTGGEGSH